MRRTICSILCLALALLISHDTHAQGKKGENEKKEAEPKPVEEGVRHPGPGEALRKGMVIGTVGDTIQTAMPVAHQVQVWQVLPEFAKPGRYVLSVQHALAGKAGAFYPTAWADTTGDGLPDKEIGRSRLLGVKKAGEWSSWKFRARTSSLFVGNYLPQASPTFYYSVGEAPRGYVGLGNTIYYSRTLGKAPTSKAAPRYTNIRLKWLGK